MKLPSTLSYDDVTLAPAYSELISRSEASTKMYNFNLPIMGSCMDTLGREIMEHLINNNIPFIAHRAFKSAEEQWNYFILNDTFNSPFERYQNIWWAVGSIQKYKKWIDYLYYKGVRNFCIDMAHGDSKACVDTIKYIKNLDFRLKLQAKVTPGVTLTSFATVDKNVNIIAGNVATASGFKRLQKAGANGIRVGIASGSICSTNIETGMGLPVLTSIIECAKVKKKNVWLIADGGIRSAGDIAKAIYFGADFCMIGKLLAATDKATGQAYDKDLIAVENNSSNIKYKAYHGMASRAARANILSYAAVEGVEGLIKFTGTTEQFINDTKLRLQSSLSYAGAKTWAEFRKRAKAYKRSTSGIIAADVHMDILTKFH